MTLSWESLDFLPRFIDSTLSWADLLLVLDTGSTDGSRNFLESKAEGDQRITVLHTNTTAETFNRGKCLNTLLEVVESLPSEPEWVAVVDCDEIFEPEFTEVWLPQIRVLPRIYSEVSFERPNLWYSETHARSDGIHARYREPAFQRYRPQFRYQERKFHLSRSMARIPVTFMSPAYLLHFELRSGERSRLQYERLREIDREWDALLRNPDDPPALRVLRPMAERRPKPVSRVAIVRDLIRSIWSWLKLRRRAMRILVKVRHLRAVSPIYEAVTRRKILQK